MFSNFDPLHSPQGFDTEIVNAAKKREIRNILKSYVGVFDSFSELIQNSMDAVDKMAESEGQNFEKKLWLKIDLQNNTFSVTDNGFGFNQKEFEAFLAPNISFKDGDRTRGNKGVGATYIAYGFNYLQLGTKHPNFNYTGEITDGRKWVEDKEGLVTRPIVESSMPIHEPFNTIGRGSTFTIKYGGDFTRPKKLTYFTAENAEQWLYLLLLKTPLGCIDLYNTQENTIKFSLSVIDSQGQESSVNDIDASYIYPHDKITATVDIKEINKVQRKLIDQGKDASRLPNRYNRLNGLYEYFNKDEIKAFRTNKIDGKHHAIIDQYEIEAYGFFGYSTSLWDEFNDNLANLRKNYRVLKGGLMIANNYMLQGDYLSIPLTSNIGYQNQTHVIVHLTNADPDLGRKGFQPELKELAENIAVAIVNKLKKWKGLLRRDSGARPAISTQIDLHSWIKDQEKYEDENPLSLNSEYFFQPINDISISSKPQSEQDVIVLFNQLVAGGVIRGLKLLATSQYATYDGIFKFYVQEPEVHHIFDKDTNPLGVQRLGIPIGTISNPQILEYKYNLDALFQEFENEEKYERDVNMAVAWKLGDNWKKNYEITSLLDLNNLHHRPFHGITHIISSGTSEFYLIVLEELIDYLISVENVQKYHREVYDEEMFR